METTIELYGADTGNCARAAIALEMAGISYLAKPVSLATGEHQSAAFRALNPVGKVPVLSVARPGAAPFLLTQSNAIILYAAELAPERLVPAGNALERARIHERFLYVVTDVIAPNHAAFALRGETDQSSALYLKSRSLAAFLETERFLSDGRFMAGDKASIADIVAFTIARSLARDIDWDGLPNLRRWFADMPGIDGVTRGLQVFSTP